MNFSGNDRRSGEVLDRLGLKKIEELFSHIPQEHRYPNIALPNGMDEQSVQRHFQHLAEKNQAALPRLNFCGAGHYYHYIPAAVNYISSLGQFTTAYTPYQAEVSQGTLQTLFEYQTFISNISQMECVNASHYDGATAFAEAMRMLYEANKKRGNTLIIASVINPEYREVLETYMQFTEAHVEYRDIFSDELQIPDDCAAVSLFLPDYFGRVADVRSLCVKVKESGALLHIHADPLLTCISQTPGELGADAYTAEGQVLGIPVSFGGPNLGIFAVNSSLIRRMPGRIAGETVDNHGQRGFVLALSTREQHIRREKASSNICTNQGLMALRAAAYVASMGTDGLRKVGISCISNIHYLMKRLDEISGVSVEHKADVHFREAVLFFEQGVETIIEECNKRNIIPGIQIDSHRLLVSVTEVHKKEDMDELIELIRAGVGR